MFCAPASVAAFAFGSAVSLRWLQHERCGLASSHVDDNRCSRRRLGARSAVVASVGDVDVDMDTGVGLVVKHFEDELDKVIVDIVCSDDSDKEGEAEENHSRSPARLRYWLNYCRNV